MRRVYVLVVLPIVLFGLETVNLIKDASFETDSEMWDVYVGRDDGDQAAAIVNKHDSERSFSGNFSALCDTREGDETVLHYDSAIVIQGFCCEKSVSDLDSLMFRFSLAPFVGGLTQGCWISLLVDVGEPQFYDAGYTMIANGQTPVPPPLPRKMIGYDNFPDDNDTSWILFSENIKADLLNSGVTEIASVDSFILEGFGGYIPPWHGQKVYWDDIRLMGYADYDVGVKEIISGDSLEVGTPYAPIARIKNFGRENADSFWVIAEIKDGASIIYSDTLPWTLEGDTEDTVTFADFDPPTTGPYTLSVRTHMEPDECDEDNEVNKEIGHSSAAENPLPVDLTLEVRSMTSPLHISYTLPYGKHGTLTLYDASGRRIERLTVTHPASVEFGSALASGVYLVRLEAGDHSISRKAVVLK